MRCNKCDKEIDDDSSFCEYCGARTANGSKNINNRLGTILILYGVSFLIGFLSGILLFFYESNDKNNGYATNYNYHIAAEEDSSNEVVAKDKIAMLVAAKKAGRDKVNCYKKDPASVETCIRAILQQSYACYMDDEMFMSAMEKEYKKELSIYSQTIAQDTLTM